MSLKPLSVSSPRSQQSSPSSQPFSSLPTSPNTDTSALSTSPRSAFVGQSPPLSAGGPSKQFDRSSPPRSTSSVGLGLGLGLPKSPRLGVGTVGLALNDDEMAQVTNPQELTSYVDKLLNDLEARFDGMSADVLSRLTSLSTRVDSLESSISDLMSGNASVALGPGTEWGDRSTAQA
ncbi:BQ2448_7678 [Microbotryum intermedium]|uniref:BQ2448_7678 protein n=1 Tax=Microbotryum intermedium TaxID=269621 RepID=A0A238FPF2_9BASI|nr:BQ2448_7678 [Microbotryum intermedium]